MKKREKNLKNAQYTLFLGCTVPVRTLNYEIAARKVAGALDIHLFDIPDFSCCGYPVKSINHYAYLLMAARNLALAEAKGHPVCTLCSSCCGSLTEANHELQEDENLRKRINEDLFRWLGLRYEGGVQVLHFTRILHQEIGVKKIEEQIQTSLSSLRVAPHYGCHYTKPSAIYSKAEDPEDPKSLDELIRATGAQSVSYEDKLSCCGGGVLAMDEQVALAMAQRKLEHIQAQLADAIVLICPFCNVMYESNQKKIEKVFQREYKLPVLFYPQLLGLALGFEPDELGLKMNRIRTTELLKKIVRRPA
ncbi:MAG: CoB--CoM heterodisulfide reductase iron-sulfur subunit B family protein [Thermodesulfobacteriota bacterium]|nr:CoB--CoM heterodisulfide reductase iron-sulfur subunit B family protein [Thermodesulfobacteriota bacterium]